MEKNLNEKQNWIKFEKYDNYNQGNKKEVGDVQNSANNNPEKSKYRQLSLKN